ncbi:hypothetical protein [Streptomyces sp. NPDC057325]
MSTGLGSPSGDSKPVKAKLRDRLAAAGRLLGGLAQATYYTLRTWLELL